jgi:hypothetical protein
MTTDELKDIIRRGLEEIARRAESARRGSPTVVGSVRREVEAREITGLRASLRAIEDGLKDLAKKLE